MPIGLSGFWTPSGKAWSFRWIMTLEEGIARGFRMDEATWERHANPWSGG
jgi:hypothetical protein